MSTIQDLFQQAQMAEAAYANFIDAAGNIITDPNSVRDQLVALKPDGGYDFSPAQATAFVAQWRVVDHIPDTASGFSATVFENIATGQRSLAIRGSTGADFAQDFRADAGDIFADGVALDQSVDLYNYWQSLTHSGIYQAAKLETSLTEPKGSASQYFLNCHATTLTH